MVNPVTPGSADTNQSLSADSMTKAAMNQKDFLKLMVAQIKNQDPLDPQTNGDFLAQLSSFSTNDSINNMEKSINSLVSSLQSNQALQASTLVGKKVLVYGNSMNLASDGSGGNAAINAVSGLSNLKASVYAATGELVKTIDLGQPPQGLFQFKWDGTDANGEHMPPGTYNVSVSGSYNNQPVTVKTMTTANVNSVNLGQNGGGLTLNLEGVGSVTLDQIQQIVS